MRILGVSAFYHDAAAALVEHGEIVAAAQEERFTRRKHDAGYPANAIRYCLDEAGLQPADLDRVAFYDKPFLKFERLLETCIAFAPRGFRSFRQAAPVWIKEKLFQKDLLRRELRRLDPEPDWASRLLFAEHHQSHAASAFYPSPFTEAAVLTMDGVGEWTTTSAAIGRGNDLGIVNELHFPHSLGLLYSAFTYHAGFKVNSGEYKLMGLAPYGEPKYVQRILDHLIDLKADGTFRLALDHFAYCTDLAMTNERFDTLFGGAPRRPEEALTQRHMDMAASVQAVIEEAVLRMTRSLRDETGMRHLCLAGGVALNCVANGKVQRDGRFDQIWIQPAAGDAGGALGAALAASHGLFDQPRRACGSKQVRAGGAGSVGDAARDAAHGATTGIIGGAMGAVDDAMRGSLLGPAFGADEVRGALDASGARYEMLTDDELLDATAAALAEGKVVGWFQGRMEFGPRALGNRSILADARSSAMQSTLNLKVKFRESFRPFAPSVLREDATDWFDLDCDSPYMLLVTHVARSRCTPPSGARRGQPSEMGRKLPPGPQDGQSAGPRSNAALTVLGRLREVRSEIPAVTHVDNSARVQTVRRETNPRFHALLTAFKAKTGCPVIVNTSFNVRGEPIVCTPTDAFRCFMGTDMDCLAIGNCFLRKEDQDPASRRDCNSKASFDPD